MENVFKKFYLANWQNQESDEDRANAAKNSLQIIKKLQKKCKDNAQKKKILNESKIGFSDDKFIKKLDLNENLIGFDNGVYDLQNKYFRNGRPSDYISISTNKDYIPYDDNNPIFKEIIKFIEEIQPSEKDILDFMKSKKFTRQQINEYIEIMKSNSGDDFRERQNYLKSYLGSLLQGHNTDETFHVFTGEGRNGKSKLVELIHACFGDYSGTLDMAAITQKRKSSSNATPEIESIIKKKIRRYTRIKSR